MYISVATDDPYQEIVHYHEVIHSYTVIICVHNFEFMSSCHFYSLFLSLSFSLSLSLSLSKGDVIAEKHCTARPQDYGLFTVVNGRATLLEDGVMPQEILMEWTLEPPTLIGHGTLSQHQPSSQFIAYKRRAPGSTNR